MNLDRLTCAFLNLPETNDHKRLLGVPKGRFDAIAVDSALRRRLAQILVHPAGRSRQAEEVRSFLQRIAADLRESAPSSIQQSGNIQPELTPLDRAIIASLIGDGGWNRKSRSRLVAVAAAFNITVGGLMRILEALAESSRSGETPLSAGRRSEVRIDRSWAKLPSKPGAIDRVEGLLDQAAKRLTPDLRVPSRVMTIKLSILFGLLTLLALILSLRVLLSDDLVAQHPSIFNNSDQNSILNSQSNEIPISPVFSIFDSYPTFPIQELGNATILEADRVLSVINSLSELSSSIRNSLLRGDEVPSDSIEVWKSSIDIISVSWPHLDGATSRSVSNSIINVLLAAQLQQVYVDELLSSLQIPNIQLQSPLSINRRAWLAGILAKISCDPKLNSTTRSVAKSQQLPRIATCDEIEAREQSLDFIAHELIHLTEFDDRIFAMWEQWIACCEELQSFEASVERKLNAMKNLLCTNVDLTRVSNTRKVLGRILQEIEWTKEAISRDFVVGLYQDISVSSNALVAMGHLFLASQSNGWFKDVHHISEGAAASERKLKSDLLLNDWPIVSNASAYDLNLSIPPGFDPSFPREWNSRLKAIQEAREDLPSNLAKLRLLNQSSVAFWRGRPDLAYDLLGKVDALELLTQEKLKVIILPNDGSWSNTYFDARSNREARINAIDTLYNSDATELGPVDAETLAVAALTQQSSQIRLAATEVIVQQFPSSANISVSIINNLHKARSKQQVARLVANLTEAILPEFSSPRWGHEARRALVQHALTVRYPEQRELDALSNELSRSLLSETLLIDPSMLPPSQELDALQAIKGLVNAWRRDLASMYGTASIIQFSPAGVMQEYLQYQLQYRQLMSYEEARWRGVEINKDSSGLITEASVHSPDIIHQVMQVEMSIARHWDHLLHDLNSEYQRSMRQ